MNKLTHRFGSFVQWFKRPTRSAPAATAAPASDVAVMIEEAEPFDPLPAKRTTKESPMDKLQRGYEEMVSLMGSVRNHLETQAERSDRLLTILQGLPEALKSLPEATRNQTRTLEAIQTNLSQQVQHNTRLADALNGLSKSTQRHEHAMGAIGQQLDASQHRSEQILGSFGTLTGTLGRMTEANEASTGLLKRMAEQESQAAEQVRQLFVRNQKQMTTMSVVSWSLALVALTVAGFVAVSVSKMNGPSGVMQVSAPAPAAATPAPAEVTPARELPLRPFDPSHIAPSATSPQSFAPTIKSISLPEIDSSSALPQAESSPESPVESPVESPSIDPSIDLPALPPAATTPTDEKPADVAPVDDGASSSQPSDVESEGDAETEPAPAAGDAQLEEIEDQQ